MSKLTRKYQATVPRAIGEVRLRKAEPLDLEFLVSLEAGLGEWASAEDDQAYDDL
jgi:antitoxin PrlF